MPHSEKIDIDRIKERLNQIQERLTPLPKDVIKRLNSDESPENADNSSYVKLN